MFEKYRGRYVAAAGGELFVADTPQDLARLVYHKYPDEVLCIHHIPLEKRILIYSNQLRVARVVKNQAANI